MNKPFKVAQIILAFTKDFDHLLAKLKSKLAEIDDAAVEQNGERCDVIRNELHEILDLIIDKKTTTMVKLHQEIKGNNNG